MATILIVDDRPSNRQFLTTLLGYGNHRLMEASDGAKALELTRAEKPDLVITDILMPNMDGFEYVQQLRSDPELASTRVIFYTATYSAPEARALAQSCGVDIVLPKPCEPQEILAAVNRALGIEIAIAASIAAADKTIVQTGGRPPIDDTGKRYVQDLQAVKLGFDEVIEHSEKLIAQRDLARGLSKKLSANVDSLQRVMSRLSALIEVGMEMESERDPAKLVQLFFAAACDIVESKYAAVAILNAQETAFSHVYAQGLESAIYQAGDSGRAGLLGSLLSGHRAIRARSADAKAGAEGLPAGHPPVRNILAVPVGSAARIYGWLYFADKPGAKEFSAEDERLASIMATKLALLYDNLTMYDAVQHHAAILQLEAAERKRAQVALQESEIRYRAIFEQAAAGIAHSDLSGRFADLNPKMLEISGYAREEILQLGIRDLTNPDDVAASEEARARLLAGSNRPYEREARLIRKDRSEVWTHITTSLVRTAAGQPAHFISIVHDISERRMAQQALAESERRFGDMLSRVELVSMMLDGEARITYCNDYLLRLTGWQREEILGRNWFEIFIPNGNTPLKDVFAALLADQPSAGHHENEILTKSGGRRLIRWNNTVLRSPGREVIGAASIGEDITDRKLAEIKITRLNRVYAVLSNINSLIVRVRDRDELFKAACRIAVDHGGFKMAWIGIVDRAAMKIVPVASAGAEPEFLTLIKDRFSLREDSPLGNTRTARAVRERKAIVVNEIKGDMAVFFAKERIERGIHSMAILPLLVSEDAVGVLALYAGEVGFFDQEEMKLLLELASDIAFALDHIEKRERLDYLAYYDQLTGLANRTLFQERLAQHIHAAEDSKSKLAVVVADIERFRMINDSLGRQAGDSLLKQIAERLARAVDQTEVARIGADQFAFMLPEVKGRSEIGRAIEETWRSCLDEPFSLSDTNIRVAMKGGVALFPSDGADADTLFKNAEAAWKKAKQTGERYLFHAPEMTARIAENLTLENKLRQALEKEEFVLHYQPKVDLETRRIAGVEALIRWRSPELGLVPPGKFIPLMEETGLILEVGAWALAKAIEDHFTWVKLGLSAPRVAVNVSAIQLRRRDFVFIVEDALTRGATPPGIDLEITESLLMEDIENNIQKLKDVRALDLGIAIDDFGTGYSSLGYLAKLPVHTLKIDRSFITGMLNDADTMTLVSTIISLAHSLRLTVVAEGVEEEEQAKMLRLLRCDQMQGYLFSKPVPVEELNVLLLESK